MALAIVISPLKNEKRLKNRNPETSQKIPSLHGLRAISILLVISSHLFLRYSWAYPTKGIKWLVFDLLKNGYLGVITFFVISGFLITTLLLQEESRNGSINIKQFFIRRTLRIFPAYYCLLIFYFLLQKTGDLLISPSSWLTALTYTKYINWKNDWYTAHAWSLSIEEQFYLVWPLIFCAGDTMRKGAAWLFFLLPPVFRSLDSIYQISNLDSFHILERIDAIIGGCLLAMYWQKFLKLVKPILNYLLLPVILLFLGLPFLRTTITNFQINIFSSIYAGIGGSIEIFGIALLIIYSINGPKLLWYKMLNSRLFVWIGTLSYSLYLWQQFFINKTVFWYNELPFNVGILFLTATVSYYFIEKPFLKLKSKWSIDR